MKLTLITGTRVPFIASHANDGNFDTSLTETSGACSYTEPTPPVWWQVDLLETYEITKVAITGRKEFRTFVFNDYCIKLIFKCSSLFLDIYISLTINTKIHIHVDVIR